MSSFPSVCLLCGGVGGARAARALAENLPAERLTFVVNTGDDFSHLGLEIWPDWDTLLYTLSETGDAVRGWGRADEGTRAMEEFRRLGAPDWFHLGDRDLALHVYRSYRLACCGADQVAQDLLRSFGLAVPVLRATQQSLSTRLRLTDDSLMEFQSWFVGRQGEPPVKAVEIAGAAQAEVTPGVLEAIAACDLLLIAPSNPYLSLHPMLEVPAIASLVRQRRAQTWAVSPLVGGKALKGPLDRLIGQLSTQRGQRAVLDWYAPWITHFLLPKDELVELESPTVSLSACRTDLGSTRSRVDFVSDLLELWNEHAQ